MPRPRTEVGISMF